MSVQPPSSVSRSHWTRFVQEAALRQPQRLPRPPSSVSRERISLPGRKTSYSPFVLPSRKDWISLQSRGKLIPEK